MRISDVSSDVCSSDLAVALIFRCGPPDAAIRRGDLDHGPPPARSDILEREGDPLRGRTIGIGHPSEIEFPFAEKRRLPGRRRRETLQSDRKSTRLNSSHSCASRMPSSACKKKNKKRNT